MAIYHASISTVSRSAGHTATAAAAYRAGIALMDEQTGLKHDYTRRGGVAETLMLAPDHAPDWAKDPARLWNAAEAAENRKNSTVAREFEISLPHELTDEQRRALVQDLAQTLVDRYDFAVQASTHAPHGGRGDDRNHHVHILATTRRMTADGLGEKTRELDGGPKGRQEIQAVREVIAGRINLALALAGQVARVDHRSLADQAAAAEQRGDLAQAAILAREPTQHEGKTVTAATRAGHVLDRARFNHELRQANDAHLTDYLAKAEAEGRLMAPTLGHQAQAIQDAKATRRTPDGPLVARVVEGYTTTRHGKAVQVGGYTRQQHSAAPKARNAGSGSILPWGVSLAPPAKAARSAGLDRGAALAGGQTVEQLAEAKRQAEERLLVERQMSHEQRLLQDYLDALAATGRKIQQQTEQALQMLVDDRHQMTAQAGRFRDWLAERGAIASALDDARAEPGKRQTALADATASLQRRRKRLDDHKTQPQEAEPSRIRWQSRRAWAERRRERTDWQQQLERKVRHAIRRETAAKEGLTPEAWEEMDRRIDAATMNLARHEATRARLFPDDCLPRPEPAPAPENANTPHPAPTNAPKPISAADLRRRLGLPSPELRPRR